MRTITIILLLTIASKLTARKDSTNKPFSSFDIYYSIRPFFGSFYNQLNSTSKFNFSSPIKTIGLGTSGHFIVTRDGDFYGHFIYNHIVPETIYVQDTLKGKITGFIFSFAYGGVLTTDKGNFALYMYFGFNTGRLKITSNELLKQKNPFFSPKLGLQPKIRFGKVALTFIFEYDYDISKTSWRRTTFAKSDQTNISKFRQTALTGQIGVGYLF